jgi:hypothetical protein
VKKLGKSTYLKGAGETLLVVGSGTSYPHKSIILSTLLFSRY